MNLPTKTTIDIEALPDGMTLKDLLKELRRQGYKVKVSID